MTHRVTIVEVSPRDGLQNEKAVVSVASKIALVNALSAAGLPVIEVTSFVSPKAIPQLADAEAVMAGIERRAGTMYTVLVPNERGYDRALPTKPDGIVVFGAASETSRWPPQTPQCHRAWWGARDRSPARWAPVPCTSYQRDAQCRPSRPRRQPTAGWL